MDKNGYKRIYLDTNLIFHWFELCLLGRRKLAGEGTFIRFLSDHKEIERYISAYTIAEIAAKLRKQFGDKVKLNDIHELIEEFRNLTGTQIIKIDEFSDIKGNKRRGILLSSNIADYAFYCCDSKDALHIDIAKSNDLLLVTADDGIPMVKSMYEKVIGESKFRKQFG